MSFVRTGLPTASVPSLSVRGHEPLDAQTEQPFLDACLEHTGVSRNQARAGRWVDIAGACAITLCVCALVAIRVAAG